jgi:WD40 repeat protein
MPAISEDGSTLAIMEGHVVRLVDRATGSVWRELRGHTADIGFCEFRQSGALLVTAASDNSLRVWDTHTGETIHAFQAPAHAGVPLVLSPDQRFVAARGDVRSTSAYLWDLKTGKELFKLDGHGRFAHGVVFSPTGDRLITIERFPRTNLYLWDVATGKKLTTLKGHKNQVNHVAFSSDGTRLVTTSMDRTVRIWDVSATASHREAEALVVLRDHTECVNHAVFNRDGSRIASSSDDRTVRYWNARTGEPLAVLCGHTNAVTQAAFREKEGEIVSVSEDGLRLWDLAGAESDHALSGHESFVYSVAYFPDGKRVASAAWDGTARIWNPTSGRELLRLDHGKERYVVSVAVHPGGKFLATIAREEGESEMSVRLWDAETGRMVHRWSMSASWHDGRLAFDPAGDVLVAGDWRGRVHIWSVQTHAEVATFECTQVAVKDLAFNPDGRFLAVACDSGDNSIRIWDAKTWKHLQTLQGHVAGVYSLAWNREGTMLASGSLDRTARLWDTRSWEDAGNLKNGTNVYGVAFTADGRSLLCAGGDNLIRAWDVAKGREVAELSGHRSYVHHLAFSPDGSQMISGSGDGSVRIWDTIPRTQRKPR